MTDDSATLQRYLESGFEALRWKLDGLSEYDLRRPLAPTGTNLLGIAKHVALVSAEYFGPVVGRASDVPPMPEDGPNADMWATADESRDYIVGLLDKAAGEAAATLTALPLEATGRVPWWDDKGDVTLHRIAVHMVAELHRHAGHADIVRELIDGEAGWNRGNSNLPGDADGATADWWAAYHDRLQATADQFR